MSYTTVVRLWPGKRIEEGEELRNSHGSAPPVWDFMCVRWLGEERGAWLFDKRAEGLWALYKRQDIPIHQRAVLMLTYDRAYVSRQNYARAVADVRSFIADANIPADHVNHWPRIAEILASEKKAPAIGLYCTSVADNPFLGPYNEKTGKRRRFDWSTAYEIYAALAKEINNG